MKTRKKQLQRIRPTGYLLCLAAALLLSASCSKQARDSTTYGGRDSDPDAHFSERQTQEQREVQDQFESGQIGEPQPEANLERQKRLQDKAPDQPPNDSSK